MGKCKDSSNFDSDLTTMSGELWSRDHLSSCRLMHVGIKVWSTWLSKAVEELLCHKLLNTLILVYLFCFSTEKRAPEHIVSLGWGCIPQPRWPTANNTDNGNVNIPAEPQSNVARPHESHFLLHQRCASATWRRYGSRMHYGKKANLQCNTFVNHLNPLSAG